MHQETKKKEENKNKKTEDVESLSKVNKILSCFDEDRQ